MTVAKAWCLESGTKLMYGKESVVYVTTRRIHSTYIVAKRADGSELTAKAKYFRVKG